MTEGHATCWMIVAVLVQALLLAGCSGAPAAPERLAAPQTVAPPELRLVALPAPDVPAGLPVAPWVLPGDTGWRSGPPLFTMANQEAGTTAEGWVAVTREQILLHAVVHDDVHFNDRTGGDIWDGDNLQIGIDALGDGSGGEPPDTEMTGPDDAELCVALTGAVPTVWAHNHGRPGGGGAMPTEYARITRDDSAGTTAYSLAFPWAEFQAAAGDSPMLGLRVQGNDRDGPGVRHVLHWGNPDNRNRPGLFNRLALGTPPREIALAGRPAAALWRSDGWGEITFNVATDRALRIHARMGPQEREFRLGRPRLADGVRRFAVRARPGYLPRTPVLFQAELIGENGTVLASADSPLHAPAVTIEQLRERTERLALAAPHPLFARHLRAVRALVDADWSRAMTLVDRTTLPAEQTVSYARAMLEALDGEAGRWETYVQGRQPLVLSFVSEYDSTLQPYCLVLPEGWQAEATYPLVVQLHGAGDAHPLSFVSSALRPSLPEPGQPQPPAWREPHVTVWPWGRGNQGYTGAAERDVWEALADASRTVHLDEDRWYLTGFSMGGAGTWHIGLRTPDRWAAICIYSGATWDAPTGLGLGQNLLNTPVRIVHGEQDGAIPVSSAHEMAAELRRYGAEPDLYIIPDLGHTYPPALERQNVNWLLQFRRRRPDAFSFVADTDEHRGVWGVWMARDVSVSALPRFECRIEGPTVRVSSEGTPGLTVQLGRGGLRLSGEVIVFWNGRAVYHGEPREVTLGSGGGWRP